MLSYLRAFQKRTPFAFSGHTRAPTHAVAPVPLYAGEPARGGYAPGPVLAHSDRHGVILFRDAPEPAWRDHGRPAVPGARDMSLRILLLQAAIILAALAWSAIVPPGVGQ